MGDSRWHGAPASGTAPRGSPLRPRSLHGTFCRMRFVFTLLHRSVGLVIAGFLLISGLTGAMISWDHELDDLLNPHLFDTKSEGAPLRRPRTGQKGRGADPRGAGHLLSAAVEKGETPSSVSRPRVDPATVNSFSSTTTRCSSIRDGGEQGRAIGARTGRSPARILVSFLYVLHYSLHIPDMWGIDRWGMWLMGGRLLWTFDCFVGFYLTLPIARAEGPRAARSSWRAAGGALETGVEDQASGQRLSHQPRSAPRLRSCGWGCCSSSLHRLLAQPLQRGVLPGDVTVSRVTPGPFDARAPGPPKSRSSPSSAMRNHHIAARRGGRGAGGAAGQRVLFG